MQAYCIVTLLTWVSAHQDMVMNIAEYTNIPKLPNLIWWFLHYQFWNNSDASNSDSDVSISTLLGFNRKIYLHTSATSVFFAPSDPSGIHSLCQEQIQSTLKWQEGPLQQDTVLVDTGNRGNMQLPMSSYVAAWVLFFFSFTYAGDKYPVALVWWYLPFIDSRCRDRETGMWLVECKYCNGKPHLAVVHVETIFCTVHLLPFFGMEPVSLDVTPDNSLDRFCVYYVNRFADHQSFEILWSLHIWCVQHEMLYIWPAMLWDGQVMLQDGQV